MKFDPKSQEYRDSVKAQAMAAMGETPPAKTESVSESEAKTPPEPKTPPKPEPEAKSEVKTDPAKWSKSFKFQDELGDETDFAVDEDSIDEVAANAFKFKTVTAELKALQDEIKSLRKGRDEVVSKAKRWLDLESSGDKHLLVEEILKSEGGIAGLQAKAVEEFKQISAMSDDERKDFEYKRAQLQATKVIEAKTREIEAKAKALEDREKANRDAEYKSMVKTIGNRYFIPNASNSEDIHAQNRAVFNEAMATINAKKAEHIAITEAIVDRAFAKAAKLLRGDAKSAAKQSAKQAAEQIDAATSAVQSAKGANKGSETPEDVLNRWVKMVREGKQREVTREAMRSAELKDLYLKLPAKLNAK